MTETMTIVRQTDHHELGLSDDDVVRMYEVMRLSRDLDDRMWLMNRQGIGHFAVPGQGHEGIAVGYAAALRPEHDWLVPHYRDLAALLYIGMTPREVMLNYLAKRDEPAGGGRQNYAHWGHDRLRIKTISSPQGPHVPHGVGIAYASRYNGTDEVTWIGFGDGTSSKGDVHEAMNFASIHELPCIFCIENNGYAISVPTDKQMAIEDVADRAAGYNMPGIVVDGTDVLAMYAASQEAVERARAGAGPTLIEAKCERLYPHTSNDDDRHYRTEEDREEMKQHDPVVQFRSYLIGAGLWSDEKEDTLKRLVETQIEDAIDFASEADDPLPEEARLNLYADNAILDENGYL